MPPSREESEGDRVRGSQIQGPWEGGPRRRRLQSTPRTAYKQAGLVGQPAGAFLEGPEACMGLCEEHRTGVREGRREPRGPQAAPPNLSVTRFPLSPSGAGVRVSVTM